MEQSINPYLAVKVKKKLAVAHLMEVKRQAKIELEKWNSLIDMLDEEKETCTHLFADGMDAWVHIPAVAAPGSKSENYCGICNQDR